MITSDKIAEIVSLFSSLITSEPYVSHMEAQQRLSDILHKLDNEQDRRAVHAALLLLDLTPSQCFWVEYNLYRHSCIPTTGE